MSFLIYAIKPFQALTVKPTKNVIRMKKEEDFIRKNYGTGNPFRVPEGYFGQFASDLMDRLPEKETNSLSAIMPRKASRLRFMRYAIAAAVCGAALLGTYCFRHTIHTSFDPPAHIAAHDTETEDFYMDDVLDYAMVSNHEIAQYLTDIH